MVRNSDTIKAPQCKYKPEYCEMLVNHLKQGLSVQTFGGTIGVVRSTIYEWINTIPEFKEAHELGLQLAQEWFEKRLMAKVSGANTPGINSKMIDTTALIFALKTRFHETYGEKSEIKNTGEIKVVIDQQDHDL